MMSSLYRMATVAALFAATACSSSSDEPTETSLAELCAGAPREDSDGVVTMVGCQFEQQAENIQRYGNAVAAQTLFDADGVALATVTRSCATWWQGKDSNGVAVTIDASSGRIASHGLVHQGQAQSLLPERAALPLSLR